MLSSSVSVVDSVRDLGVVIDSRLTDDVNQVTALCRACYYQLRRLRPVARALPEAAAKTLVQAFISCRLDYCNALLYGCLLYTSPSPRDGLLSRMPSSA